MDLFVESPVLLNTELMSGADKMHNSKITNPECVMIEILLALDELDELPKL